MTDIHELVKSIESSKEYKKHATDTWYLSHVFFFQKRDGQQKEAGYYDESTDKVTVFTINPITSRPPEAVIKETDKLQRLVLTNLTVGLEEARKIAHKFVETKHPGHPIDQEIFILQQLDNPRWNVTLVTKTLNFLHLKINAEDGEVFHSEMKNIMDLRAK